MRTSLYRHFAADGALLYVGISLDATARLGQHMRGSAWKDEIENVSVVNFDTLEEARAAEAAAITAERPRFNKRHARSDAHPVSEILSRWPTRSDVAADADVPLVVVHRWFQRNAIKPTHWRALLNGAAARGIGLTADELVDAHTPAGDA